MESAVVFRTGQIYCFTAWLDVFCTFEFGFKFFPHILDLIVWIHVIIFWYLYYYFIFNFYFGNLWGCTAEVDVYQAEQNRKIGCAVRNVAFDLFGDRSILGSKSLHISASTTLILTVLFLSVYCKSHNFMESAAIFLSEINRNLFDKKSHATITDWSLTSCIKV